MNWEKKFRQNICKLQVISNVEKSFHEEYFIFSVPDFKEDTNLPPAVSFSDMIRNFINNATAIFTGQNTPKKALRLSPTLRLRQSNKNPIIVRIPIVNVQVSRIFFCLISQTVQPRVLSKDMIYKWIVWFKFQISFKRRLFEQSIGYIFCILTHNVREFVRDPKEFAKFLFCFGIMSPNVVVPYVLNLLGKLGRVDSIYF